MAQSISPSTKEAVNLLALGKLLMAPAVATVDMIQMVEESAVSPSF
jgi:hypothetical protein